MVLSEIHCAELELAGSPPWTTHTSVFQSRELVTLCAVWKWGWRREIYDVSILLLLLSFCCCSCLTHQVSASLRSVRFHQHPVTFAERGCGCLYGYPCHIWSNYPYAVAFFVSPSLSCLTAKLLYSTQLYHFCRVEWKKGKAGIFIIITSHFCNLYAMRTLRACSYNQVCRNHVRCFRNSWGDSS